MAREMDNLAREKEQQWAKLVSQYGSEEAVLAAYKKKKELAERNIERKADYQTFSPESIGESMPAKPATTAQKLALFQQANPSALLSPRDSIKDQMNISGVPTKEIREAEYKEFSDESALLDHERAKRGDPRVVEQTTGRREDLLTEALPVYQAMERAKKREKLEEQLQRDASTFQDDDPELGHGGGRPKWNTANREQVASMEQGNIEQQMAEGMAKDQEALQPGDVTTEEDERAVNEEFMATGSVAETEEVIAAVAEETGSFSEATAASKEATGRYVRYDGATKQGITINKSYLEKLHDRKGKMALLQHIPQENRAALLFNWGLISPEDLSDTQQQSAKEVLELEKIKLQVAELKNKTGKMTDQEKAQVTAASNGLAKAVEDRRWDEAEGFQAQLNALMPDRKPLDFEKIQKSIDKKLLARPELTQVKELMGKQVWDGYFEFKNDLVKKIDTLKRSSAGSGELAKFLGAPITEGENAGKTWSDVLEGQGISSWNTIKNLPEGKEKELALKISGGKTDNIRAIKRSHYMGYVLPRLRLRIMENNYGKWHNTIEQELHGAQGKATAEHQKIVNENAEPRPEEAKAKVEPTVIESAIPAQPSQAPPTPEEHAASLQQEDGAVEEPLPEANLTDMQKLQKKHEEDEAAKLAEKERRTQADIDAVKTWKEKSAMELQNMEPDEKADYEEFTTYQIPMLEKNKGDKTFLKNLLGKYKKLQKKFKDAGKKTYKEDYNIAYINMLLNK